MPTSIVQTWIPGTSGNWFDAQNWITGQVPASGNAAIVNAGTAIVAATSSVTTPAIEGVSLLLGGLDVAQPVTLEAIGAVFEGITVSGTEIDTVLRVEGGEPTSGPLDALFLAEGNTSFDGQILVSAAGGSLTIRAQPDGQGTPGHFTFSNADLKAVMVVGQESVLNLAGQAFTNDGLIQVLGGSALGAGATLDGTGAVILADGGHMAIAGTVASQDIDFADGTGAVTLSNVAGFAGTFGFGYWDTSNIIDTVAGDRIDLAGIQAQSLKYVAGAPGTLEFYADPGQQGPVVATLHVQLIDEESLSPLPGNKPSADDFTLSSDGHGGTLLTYTPPIGIQLQQSLPVPVVATAGTVVSLASILQNAFGTSDPGFTSLTLLPAQPFVNSATDVGYWDTPDVTPTWQVNGQAITGNTVVTDISTVSLRVGNQIMSPAAFRAGVTAATSGPQSETVTYSVWSVDPRIAAAVQQAGFGPVPTPASVVASANAFDDTFPGVPNLNLCNWIADNVAAGADAAMPLPNQVLDPSLNVEGGFWRIAYRGSSGSLLSNWSGLVRPGDIVRMGWFSPAQPAEQTVSGHSTTVLGAVDAQGQISVYDNIAYIENPDGTKTEVIGVHPASYWEATDPADITIYRLDPNQQYLILGTSLAEVIQGSVFDDLIRPGGGADVITGGPGANEIQDTTDNLNSIKVTDFGVGDLLDFTDLDPTLARLSFMDGVLGVSDGFQAAQLLLAGLSNPTFQSAPDGNGGTFVSLAGGHGDVHMVTFAGLAYDFQAVGDFVAVESTAAGDPWQVQIRTASFPNAASITTGLAALVGAERVTFALDRPAVIEVDGIPDPMPAVGETRQFEDGVLSRIAAGSYALAWSDGRRLTVTEQQGYFDWTVALAGRDGPGSIRGLLGGNLGQDADFQLRTGAFLSHPNDEQILGVFAESWRLPTGASLLAGPAPT